MREVDKLRLELATLPEHVIVDSTEYKCLQSQVSCTRVRARVNVRVRVRARVLLMNDDVDE